MKNPGLRAWVAATGGRHTEGRNPWIRSWSITSISPIIWSRMKKNQDRMVFQGRAGGKSELPITLLHGRSNPPLMSRWSCLPTSIESGLAMSLGSLGRGNDHSRWQQSRVKGNAIGRGNGPSGPVSTNFYPTIWADISVGTTIKIRLIKGVGPQIVTNQTHFHLANVF